MSSPASEVDVSSLEIPSLDNTYGALLLSAFATLLLYGLTVAQTIQYSRQYYSDRLPLKSLVVVILFYTRRLYFVTKAISCRYRLIVWLIANTESLYRLKTISQRPQSEGTAASHPLHIQSTFIPPYFLLDILSFKEVTLEDAPVRLGTAIFGIALLIDLILTGTLVTIMRQNKTGFLTTDSTLDMLARYAVAATGAMLMGLDLQSLALPHSFVYSAIALPTAEVYSNSVLAVLNCRKSHPGFRTGITAADQPDSDGNHRLSRASCAREAAEATVSNLNGLPSPSTGQGFTARVVASSHIVLDLSSWNDVEGAESVPGERKLGACTGLDSTEMRGSSVLLGYGGRTIFANAVYTQYPNPVAALKG
ncbi:hypothetical protein V8D89_001640 [Ganoderma adspersum]